MARWNPMELYSSLYIRAYDVILIRYTCVPGFHIGGHSHIHSIWSRLSSGSTYRVGTLLVPIFQMCEYIFRYFTRCSLFSNCFVVWIYLKLGTLSVPTFCSEKSRRTKKWAQKGCPKFIYLHTTKRLLKSVHLVK